MKPRRRSEDGFKTFGFRRSRAEERGGKEGSGRPDDGPDEAEKPRSRSRAADEGVDEVLDWEESRRVERKGRKERPGTRGAARRTFC